MTSTQNLRVGGEDYEREYDDLMDEYEAKRERARYLAGCACFPGGGPGTCPGRDRCPLEQPDDEGDDE